MDEDRQPPGGWFAAKIGSGARTGRDHETMISCSGLISLARRSALSCSQQFLHLYPLRQRPQVFFARPLFRFLGYDAVRLIRVVTDASGLGIDLGFARRRQAVIVYQRQAGMFQT